MIDSYDFGHITIDGKSYSSDVIIFPERVNDSWWRKDGHNLCLDDVKEILEYKPDVLIIGKGYSGIMTVSSDIQSQIERVGIKVIALNTIDAVKKYNETAGSKKVVAALHLTC